jgi:hypothetical protein
VYVILFRGVGGGVGGGGKESRCLLMEYRPNQQIPASSSTGRRTEPAAGPPAPSASNPRSPPIRAPHFLALPRLPRNGGFLFDWCHPPFGFGALGVLGYFGRCRPPFGSDEILPVMVVFCSIGATHLLDLGHWGFWGILGGATHLLARTRYSP